MSYTKYLFIGIFFFFSLFFQAFGFSDTENNWYKQSIIALQEQGIVNGFPDGTFLPNDTSTRAEILKIILNSSKTEIQDTQGQCFSDVSSTDWFSKYICSGVEKGITKGYEDGTFQPNGDITVLETLAFGVRAFGIDISGIPEGENWYEKYQIFADENNIVPIHAYRIQTLINRGRAADIIYRLQQYSQGQKLDYLSQGCQVSPSLKTGSYTIQVGDSQRKYLLYVPRSVSQSNPLGLIVAFHGRTNSNEMVRDYMQLGGGSYGSTKNQNDFIVAYPEGMGNGPYSWSQYENIELFDAIITKVSQELCIDRDTVFSVGHSLGSYMSNKVSCLRGGVIRAMVGVASSGYADTCTGPVTSLILHLPGDRLASYGGGEGAYDIKTEKNSCGTAEKSISLGDIQGCTQKLDCSSGNTVIFCNSYTPYLNDPHSWPKNGGDDILDFLKEVDKYTD